MEPLCACVPSAPALEVSARNCIHGCPQASCWTPVCFWIGHSAASAGRLSCPRSMPAGQDRRAGAGLNGLWGIDGWR